jgi:FkbH-like protein
VTGEATTLDAARARLATPGLDLGEVSALVTRLEREAAPARSVSIGVSANVTVDLLEPYLRRQALLDGYRAVVHAGSYADHLGNVRRFREAGVEVLLLLDLFDNLLPALEARAATLPAAERAALRDRLREELRLVLEQAKGIGRVYLCLLHRWSVPAASGVHARLDAVVEEFNQALREVAAPHANVRLLYPADVVARVGWERAFSSRFYFRYRSPYTTAFFEELARQVSHAGRGAGAHFYKVLVLDADNTLWGGILGEDRPEGIKLAPHDHPGSVYWHAQQEFLALQQQGVLLCLCSKNNPGDVEAVLASHPNMVLRAEHFAARQVNWDDKPTNLRRIAATLNLGLDSMVFLDDSTFECEAVRGQLPMVRTFQVPARLHEFPAVLHELKQLFLAGGISAESAAKTEQYRVRALAEEERSRFASQEEYLASLGLQVDVRRNEAAAIPRISELTRKSNQFNLTTRRYDEAQVRALMEAADSEVFSIHVRDRFGDSGLTGVAILRYRDDAVAVDSFLLSCRVIGRGVETAVWRGLLEHAAVRGAHRVEAEYLPTAKNAQVSDFWDRLGLGAPPADPSGRRAYSARVTDLRLPATPHIEVKHVH